MRQYIVSSQASISAHYQKIMMYLSFCGQTHAINQISYETDDFKVVELQDGIELNGYQEQYLAVTRDNKLYSIDVYAGPEAFLTSAHGYARIESM